MDRLSTWVHVFLRLPAWAWPIYMFENPSPASLQTINRFHSFNDVQPCIAYGHAYFVLHCQKESKIINHFRHVFQNHQAMSHHDAFPPRHCDALCTVHGARVHSGGSACANGLWPWTLKRYCTKCCQTIYFKSFNLLIEVRAQAGSKLHGFGANLSAKSFHKIGVRV